MAFERHRISWRGRADAVTVVTFMPRFPHRLPMTQDGADWSVDLHLPADARIEYRLEIRRGGRYETTLDPLNPVIASNPFGTNSVLTGSRYRTAAQCSGNWRVDEFRVLSEALGGRRHHRLAQPAATAATTPLPLVMLHDGSDYLEHAAIAKVLASAISTGMLPPMRLALLDPRRRNVEYAADERHSIHVANEILPRLLNRYATDGRIVVGGASLGAVASWHIAWSLPGTVTGLVLQSGTFASGAHGEIPAEMAGPLHRFMDAVGQDARAKDLAIGQTCGRYESLIDWNRRTAAMLADTARVHSYEERWTGHDWGAWADMFCAALSTALTPTE